MNRLATETSPYLRQHADNPVDWYPWGAEAFATAEAEDKPILLSVGYSACHWCHVMAHESFEDDDDRRGDERPVREREGRPRGAARRRRDLHGRGAGAHRPRRLADDGVPHARRPPVLRRHLLPQGRPPGHARLRPGHGRDRGRLANKRERRARPGRAADDRDGRRARCATSSRPATTPAALSPRCSTRPRTRSARASTPTLGGFGARAEVPARRWPIDFLLRRYVRNGDARDADDGDHDARRDGRGRDLRPRRRRLRPVLDRRALARSALREDALRPGAARRRVPARLPRRPATRRGTGGSSRRRSPTCCATCATPTAASSRPRTRTAKASRASSTSGASRSSPRCAATRRPRSSATYGVTAGGNFRDPHTGYSGNILHLVDRTEDPSAAVTRRAAAGSSSGARRGSGPGSTTRCCSAGTRSSSARWPKPPPRSTGPTGWTRRAPTPGSSRASLRRDDGRLLRSWHAERRGRHLAVAEDYAALLEAFVTLAEVDDVAWLADARACADELFRLFHDEQSGGFFTTGQRRRAADRAAPGLLRQRHAVGELARGRRAAPARRAHRRRRRSRRHPGGCSPSSRDIAGRHGSAASPSCSAPTSGRSRRRSRSRSSATTRRCATRCSAG